MRSITRTGIAVGLALAAAAVFGPTTAATAATPAHRAGAALFAQTDNLAGNAVVVYDRAAGGQLVQTGNYPTGGLGGQLDGSVVDHLASQGSLAYDGHAGLVYAVNAGSDTLTVFAVHGDHLTRVQTIGTGGDFPVSVTTHGHLVYVLNARSGGSVQGFLRLGDRLVRVPFWHRGLGLDPTLAPEFTHTPGQVAFTPDGTRLVVTTKANTNSIDVYAVGALGGPSATPVVTPEPGAVPFAVAFDPAGHLVVASAGGSTVSTFRINHDRSLTSLDTQATGQAATCWVTVTGHYLYASNAGSADVSGYRVAGTGALTSLGTTGTDAGTVDAAAASDGRYLYVQTGAAGIVDAYRVGAGGSLTPVGSVTVPGAAGGEGIAAA